MPLVEPEMQCSKCGFHLLRDVHDNSSETVKLLCIYTRVSGIRTELSVIKINRAQHPTELPPKKLQ